MKQFKLMAKEIKYCYKRKRYLEIIVVLMWILTMWEEDNCLYVKLNFLNPLVWIFYFYAFFFHAFSKGLPEAIVDKMSANQRAMQRENELREARAMAEKKVIEAQADAAANRAKMQTITPQLVEWERLQITKQFVDKWNGSSVPQYMCNGSNFNLLFNAGK